MTAQVTQNIYDSVTGRRLLIAQGARLIGDYQSDVGFGQRRVLLAWNRLILPDGRSIVLERQPAADPAGWRAAAEEDCREGRRRAPAPWWPPLGAAKEARAWGAGVATTGGANPNRDIATRHERSGICENDISRAPLTS